MQKNVYECMFILDANAYARNPAGAAESISRMVEQVDGEMLASRLWNEQKLAYQIKGRHKGAYWLSYAKIDSNQLSQFNRACQLNDIVLRHLVVKIDPRLVETLVSATTGAVQVPTADQTVEEVDAGDGESKDGDVEIKDLDSAKTAAVES